MSVNTIEKKQNEDRMLRYQYASRSYYNCAQTLNDLVWVFCVIAWLTIFWPNNYSTGRMFPLAVSSFASIIAAILNSQMTAKVSLASALRNYFDTYVLGINTDQITELTLQEMEELSIKAVKRRPEESKEQMSNTGHNNPPGVRNWYEFSNPLSEEDAIYECQKQNCWWNKKIIYKSIIITALVLFVLVSLAIFLLIKTKTGIMFAILSSFAFLSKCALRLYTNWKYYRLSLKIDGALDVLTNSRSDENIINLQTLIDARRSIPVLGRNNIHKRHAKEYAELYNKITKFKK